MKIVEYYLRSALSEGLDELRKNTDTIDEVFQELACPPLSSAFGDKIIDEIKCFFRDNDIPVRSAFSQNQIELPSLTVHLLSSQEAPEYRSMQDHISYQRAPKAPSVLQGPFYGLAYDSETGKLTLPKTFDTSRFIKGRKIFSAEDDEVYTIKGTMKLNDPGTAAYDLQEQSVCLVNLQGEVPESVKFAKLSLLSSVDFALKRVAGTWFREVFEIRVNAQTNSDQAVWLYYITAYILLRNKWRFEEVGLESQTFGVSEFTRDVGKMPNNIWGRTIRLTFLVQHQWKEDVESLELVGVNLNAENSVTNEITFLTED
jgi:hypothetical protein